MGTPLDADVTDLTELAELVAAATGRTRAAVAEWHRAPVGPVANMTTRSLDRVTGRLEDGSPFSLIAKTVHPASESPIWDLIPPPLRAVALEDLNWLDEPRVYECGLRAHLPAPLAMPEVYRIDRSPDALTIWMEDVHDDTAWDLARVRRSAHALGRLAGTRTADDAAAQLGLGRRPMSRLFHGKICNFDLLVQSQDEFWLAPAVAAAVDERHRGDLMALAEAMPALLDELDASPYGIAHGDAAPDNLLEPGDGRVVAVDWSYGCVAPVGSDLAQLLAGAVASGAIAPSELDQLATNAVEAFLDGFRAQTPTGRAPVDTAVVERAWTTEFAVRAVFSALLVEPVADEDADEFHERVRRGAVLARFGLDRAAALTSTR